MQKILWLFFPLLSPCFAQAILCALVFTKPLYSNPEAHDLALRTLTLSQQLAEDPPFSKRMILNWKLQQTYRMLHKTLAVSNSPTPFYLAKEFFGEFHWTNTVVSGRFGAYVRTRTPYLNETQRNDMQIEATPWGVLHSVSQSYLQKDIVGIFVIGLDGLIYAEGASNEHWTRFRHSSFFAGAPVLFAGTIHLKPDGSILSLTRRSGHYKPSAERLLWARAYLQAIGFKFSDQ
jgi:hypothetical protein